MNKKAQLPQILLPLLAIILSGIALYSFATVDKTTSTQDLQITDMINGVNFNSDYIKAEAKVLLKETSDSCDSCSQEDLTNTFKDSAAWRAEKLASPDLGNLFSKIYNEEFSITTKDDSLILNITDITIQSKQGYNSFTRSLNICLELKNDEITECPVKAKFINNK